MPIKKISIVERARVITTWTNKDLLYRLRGLNPFGGYTMDDMSRLQLIDTILLYEYGPEEWKKFRS